MPNPYATRACSLGTPAVVLSARTQTAAAPLRVLHAWHLLSLDAPTVAFCWVVLFGEVMHVPHTAPAAAALACAVWLVYVADRLLDVRNASYALSPALPQAQLPRLYRQHRTSLVVACGAVALATGALLTALPASLAEAWLLLAVPLALYAAAVHLLHLPARWKGVCVGIFFAVSVALPSAVHGRTGWPLAFAALAFGGLCRANCAVLRAPLGRRRIVFAAVTPAILMLFCLAEVRVLAFACASALFLLLVLEATRDALCRKLGWLAWRALVDAALVVPGLVCSLAAFQTAHL